MSLRKFFPGMLPPQHFLTNGCATTMASNAAVSVIPVNYEIQVMRPLSQQS